MNGECTGQLSGATIIAMYLSLLLFGIAFNLFTAWAEGRGYVKGYVSLFVVAGVAITVGTTALISLPFALVSAGAFVASGTPMIAGSIWRHMRERERQLEELRKEAEDGDAA